MPLSVELLNDILTHEIDYNLNTAARILNKPWLIAQGTEDPSVKTAVAENFHRLQSGSELLVIEGTNHVFGASHPYNKAELPEDLERFAETSIDFIKQ